ncbi:MAG TPA: endonuclease/exonuclease/phosphatase family protein [Terriglobia bacterium]|nr:endonuclease/exonuclease/phosphatase family protein [Terriglobia bacterium]
MTIQAGRLHTLRIATYNIHKCRGLDQRVHPRRISQVLGELDADIVALQEVVGQGSHTHEDQTRYVAEALGYHLVFGENRRHNGGAYGNLLLSRFPIVGSWNYDITTQGREPRGVLRADVRLAGEHVLHLFNVHLGTAYRERAEQARRMVSLRILRNAALTGTRIVLGDFNEWIPGEATRLLSAHFGWARRLRSAHRRTYPCVLPLLRLDHIYFDENLELHRLALHRSPKALVASDHLPVLAEFSLKNRPAASAPWHEACIDQAEQAPSIQPQAAHCSLDT